MSKKVLILTTLVLAFSVCKLHAEVVHSTWIGSRQDNWGSVGNWDPRLVPNNSDWQTFVVTIDSGSDGIDIGLHKSYVIDSLDCYGEVELVMRNGWATLTLEDPNGLTNHGDLWIDEVNVHGNITNTDGAALNLVDIDIAEGNFNNAASGTTKIELQVWLNGNVENAGSMTIVPAATLIVEEEGNTFHNTGRLNIYNGHFKAEDLLHNYSNGVIQGSGIIFADELQNNGEIYADGGPLAINCESLFTNTGVLCNKPLCSLHIKSAEGLNNLGTIEVNAGGGVAFDCNIVNEPNAVIKLMGGTLAAKTITQNADAHFTGQGNITGNLAIESDALVNLTGPTNIFGNIEINPDGKLEISDGTVLITGHTICNGTIYLKGGRIIPQGGLSGDCNIISEPSNNNIEDLAVLADTWLGKTN